MAKNTGPSAIVSRVCAYLVDFTAQLLEDQEREAVIGDLRELEIGQGRALRELMGLVARRQVALWMDWRIWLNLLGVIAPLALLVSIMARQSAGESSVYVWLYANNLDLDLLRNGGFWYELAHSLPVVLEILLKLFCCSWTAGFVVGSISARTPRLNRAVLLLALLLGFLVGAPVYLDWRWQSWNQILHLPALPDAHAPLSANMFYRFVFPVIVTLILVVAPSLWGLRDGLGARNLRYALRLAVRSLCVLAVAEMLEQNLPVWVLSPANVRVVQRYGAYVQLSPLLLYWPVAFLLGNAVIRRIQPKRIGN